MLLDKCSAQQNISFIASRLRKCIDGESGLTLDNPSKENVKEAESEITTVLSWMV